MTLDWLPNVWYVGGIALDYVAKLAPVGAFVVALSVFRRQQSDNRMLQASKTSIYTAKPFTVERPIDSRISTCWKIGIRNHSDLPIYRAVAQIDRVWENHFPGKHAHGPSEIFDRIDPGTEETAELYTPGQSADALLGLVFEDSSGRAWYRSSDGAIYPARGRKRWSRKAERHKRRWAKYRKIAPMFGGIPRRTQLLWNVRRRISQIRGRGHS